MDHHLTLLELPCAPLPPSPLHEDLFFFFVFTWKKLEALRKICEVVSSHHTCPRRKASHPPPLCPPLLNPGSAPALLAKSVSLALCSTTRVSFLSDCGNVGWLVLKLVLKSRVTVRHIDFWWLPQ